MTENHSELEVDHHRLHEQIIGRDRLPEISEMRPHDMTSGDHHHVEMMTEDSSMERLVIVSDMIVHHLLWVLDAQVLLLPGLRLLTAHQQVNLQARQDLDLDPMRIENRLSRGVCQA